MTKQYNYIIINKGMGFIKNFNLGGLQIPHFGDIKDSKRFNDKATAKKAIGNHPDCFIVLDIYSI